MAIVQLAKFLEWWGPTWEGVKFIVAFAWDVITKVLKTSWLFIIFVIEKGMNFITETLIPTFLKIAGFWVGVWNTISNTVSIVWAFISWILQKNWSDIKSLITLGLESIKEKWDNAWNKMSETFDDVWESIKSVGSGVWETIKSTFKTGLNGIIGVLNDGIGKINGMIDKLRSTPIVGDSIPDINIPEIPKLARGTRNFSGGMALVGERGPELVNLPGGSRVIPANQTKSNGASIVNNFYNTDIDANALSSRLMFQLHTI